MLKTTVSIQSAILTTSAEIAKLANATNYSRLPIPVKIDAYTVNLFQHLVYDNQMDNVQIFQFAQSTINTAWLPHWLSSISSL